MAACFEIKTRSDGQFVFDLKAGDDEAILTSQAFSTKAACMHGVEFVKTNASDDNCYPRITTPDWKFWFALEADNGQAIGASEYYETAVARDDTIEFVKTAAPDAEVKDLTQHT